MKIFLKKIIVFLALFLLIATIIQIALSVKIKGKIISGHDNLEQIANADVVFLGSSRCWVQFDPHFFDKTFKVTSANIGVDGHSEIAMAIVRLKDYLERNKPPKFAILSFDPLMSAGSEKNNTNYVHKDNFARYAFYPNSKDLLFVNYFNFTTAEKYIPLYSIFKYNLLYNAIFTKKNDSYITYGYEKHDEQWDTISNPITGEMKNCFFTARDIPSVTNSLNELNDLCIKNNIKLLCIQTPVYKVIQDDIVFSYPASIAKSLAIPFIDVNVPSIRNNITYFYNSDHLNTSGIAQIDTLFKRSNLLNTFLKQ